MHVLRLRLLTKQSDETEINRRFHAVSHLHNVMTREAVRRLNRLKQDPDYQKAKAVYGSVISTAEENRTDDEKRIMKDAVEAMNDCTEKYGLTKQAFELYLKKCQKTQFRKMISSQQAQKEADRVFSGVEKVLYGSGKKIHFKKFRDFDTISGKSNINGAKFDKAAFSIDWLGLHIRCDISRDIDYIRESISGNDVSYCEIKRMMFNNGWHYYVLVYLSGDAPRRDIRSEGSCMGIDPGMSTIAGFSDTRCVLEELAPRMKEYNRRISDLLRSMDWKKRLLNPEKYNEDGTVNKADKDSWTFSKNYLKLRNRLKTLYRQKTAYVRQSHLELIYKLLEDSIDFIAEDMNWTALAKRSKKTERQMKPTELKQKDGTVRTVYKYKKKRRFGKSVNDRSPGLFMTLLEQKAVMYGGTFNAVDTASFRASQYDHVRDECIKVPLSLRMKTVGGHLVQRDLYSAFLIRNSDDAYEAPDRWKCIASFETFLRHQGTELLCVMGRSERPSPCFGLKRLHHRRNDC